MIKSFKKAIVFIKHSILGCPDSDLHYVNKSYAICTKCDKKHFIFNSY